jgi:hypothetical protein
MIKNEGMRKMLEMTIAETDKTLIESNFLWKERLHALDYDVYEKVANISARLAGIAGGLRAIMNRLDKV